MKPQTWRPADLAAVHGLSAQTVRNYEQAGVLPPADRSPTGYRRYAAVHAAALDTYLALIPGFGHATGAEIMRAVNRADPDAAFHLIDAAHAQLLADRGTLDAVESAIRALSAGPVDASHKADHGRPIGAVAHRLGVTPATLRKWERAGILVPRRERGTRVYRAADLRDADLAHLLRRGGYPLAHIATVLDQTRRAGGAEALADSLANWRRRIGDRARAMLTGAARLDNYLSLGADLSKVPSL